MSNPPNYAPSQPTRGFAGPIRALIVFLLGVGISFVGFLMFGMAIGGAGLRGIHPNPWTEAELAAEKWRTTKDYLESLGVFLAGFGLIITATCLGIAEIVKRTLSPEEPDSADRCRICGHTLVGRPDRCPDCGLSTAPRRELS